MKEGDPMVMVEITMEEAPVEEQQPEPMVVPPVSGFSMLQASQTTTKC